MCVCVCCVCVTYDGSVGLCVDGTQAFELHHGLRLLSLLTTTLQIPVEEIDHLQRRRENRHCETWRTGSGPSHRSTDRCTDCRTGQVTCCRHQARPLVILWMAICRLFISPSSSGADRLSELKLLRSRARKRFNSCRQTERETGRQFHL